MRKLLLWIVLPILLVAVAAVAWLEVQTRTAANVLASQARTVAARTYARPLHVTISSAARFADAFPAVIEPMRQALQQDPSAERPGMPAGPCAAWQDGEQPLATLPPDCKAALERNRGSMEGLLAASRTSAAGPPVGLGALDLPADPPPQVPDWFVLRYGARLAALDVRMAAARGDAAAAVGRCLEVLALARDAGLGTMLVGRSTALDVEGIVFRPCREALEIAPAQLRRQAAEAIRVIASARPSAEDVLRDDAVHQELGAYGALLSSSTFESLPPRAQPLARAHPYAASHTGSLGWLEKIGLGRFAREIEWMQQRPQTEVRLGAAVLPEEQRVEELTRLTGDPTGAVPTYAVKDNRSRAQALALGAAALVGADAAEGRPWKLPANASSTAWPLDRVRIDPTSDGSAATFSCSTGGEQISLVLKRTSARLAPPPAAAAVPVKTARVEPAPARKAAPAKVEKNKKKPVPAKKAVAVKATKKKRGR